MESPSPPTAAPSEASPDLAAFERAYLDFLQALRALATGSGLQDQLAQSYAEYHRALGGGVPNEQAQHAAADAYARHNALLQQALSPEYQRQRACEAFQQYLQAVKTAWTGIDERSVPPAALAAIGQSMAAVAMTIAGVIGPAGLAPAHQSVAAQR